MLNGRVALVTGASRGIGKAIALALANDGADVAINFRTRAAEAEDVRAQAVLAGRKSIAIQADVSLRPDVERMVRATESSLGPIGILVNNAGIARLQKIEEITELDWDELLSVNLKSCFLVTQAVVAGMRARRWGRIISISSVAAQTGGVVGAHYAASKAGMSGLMRYCAKYFAAEGITANTIAPALIKTEMSAANTNVNPALIPVGRLGDVEEVAQVAVMLARNGYITGQTIHVNGGWYVT